MKRLIDIPDKLDDLIVKYSKKMSYPITHCIKQILWEWVKQNNLRQEE